MQIWLIIFLMWPDLDGPISQRRMQHGDGGGGSLDAALLPPKVTVQDLQRAEILHRGWREINNEAVNIFSKVERNPLLELLKPLGYEDVELTLLDSSD